MALGVARPASPVKQKPLEIRVVSTEVGADDDAADVLKLLCGEYSECKEAHCGRKCYMREDRWSLRWDDGSEDSVGWWLRDGSGGARAWHGGLEEEDHLPDSGWHTPGVWFYYAAPLVVTLKPLPPALAGPFSGAAPAGCVAFASMLQASFSGATAGVKAGPSPTARAVAAPAPAAESAPEETGHEPSNAAAPSPSPGLQALIPRLEAAHAKEISELKTKCEELRRTEAQSELEWHKSSQAQALQLRELDAALKAEVGEQVSRSAELEQAVQELRERSGYALEVQAAQGSTEGLQEFEAAQEQRQAEHARVLREEQAALAAERARAKDLDARSRLHREEFETAGSELEALRKNFDGLQGQHAALNEQMAQTTETSMAASSDAGADARRLESLHAASTQDLEATHARQLSQQEHLARVALSEQAGRLMAENEVMAADLSEARLHEGACQVLVGRLESEQASTPREGDDANRQRRAEVEEQYQAEFAESLNSARHELEAKSDELGQSQAHINALENQHARRVSALEEAQNKTNAKWKRHFDMQAEEFAEREAQLEKDRVEQLKKLQELEQSLASERQRSEELAGQAEQAKEPSPCVTASSRAYPPGRERAPPASTLYKAPLYPARSALPKPAAAAAPAEAAPAGTSLLARRQQATVAQS